METLEEWAADTTASGILLQLLSQITELNGKLVTATASIDQLTKQVGGLQAKRSSDIDTVLLAATNGHSDETMSPSLENTAKIVKPRKLGYINWASHHKQAESKYLVKLCDLKEALENLIVPTETEIKFQQGKSILAAIYGDPVLINQPQSRNQILDRNQSTYQQDLSNNLVEFKSVTKDIRFPQDAVYIDTNKPHVLCEMKFLKEINVPPTPGVVERFLNIIEQEIHTTASFEAEHNLKWV